jgi:predicted lipoprotein with Yx(FWY)xxD motif
VQRDIIMGIFATANVLNPDPSSLAPATTPKGITIVDVERELEFSQPEFLWIRPGDADGRTLFVSDADAPGVSKCEAACAKEWIPLAVTPGVKATGDWTIIARADGVQQWAYNKRPVYTWVKEERPGDVATGVAVDAVFNSKLAQKVIAFSDMRPPQGWSVLRFEPAVKAKAPDGIDARINVYAQGVTLTDFAGLTLYTFAGEAKKDGQQCSSAGCATPWAPVLAPALAANVGDFSIVARHDGSRQWAYQKKPLYRFKADLLPGDTKGLGVDQKFAPAMLTQTFRPAGVAITPLNGYGAMLTIDGKALYTGIAYEARWGGRNLRDGYRNMYYKGKQMGGQTCVSAACLALWQPFRPGADAQSNGYWEVITRDDGSKQWAYKGYALYTYTGDKAPGDFNGNDTYDSLISDGPDDQFQQANWLVEMNGRAGVYWHIAKP